MQLEPLQHLLHGLVGVRVLSVGDVMLDRFVYGDVSRVSAEAPIPILAHARESRMLGGAGNVARNIIALGGQAELVGLVGSDLPAKEIETLLAQDGIGSGLVVDADRCSTVKMRFASAGQQLLRVDTEVISPASAQAEHALVGAIHKRARGCGAVLLSDYGKGVVTPAIIEACLEAAKVAGARLLVDSKARRFGH